MSTVNNEMLSYAFELLIGYIAEKGLDKLTSKKTSDQEEMSIEEHAYCLLTESLEEFCKNYRIEFDENAIADTLVIANNEIISLKRNEQLKRILEIATGLEISAEELITWVTIVENQLVRDKHQKLFRAIQLKSMKENSETLVEPAWMQRCMANNFFEVAFEKIAFDKVFRDIRTGLSNICWIQTQDLILELALNAFQHGNAKHIWLLITEKAISIIDDGSLFNTMLLTESSTKLSGGNWTMDRFIKTFPEANILYEQTECKNKTSIQFEHKVFNVNGLCRIDLPTKMLYRASDIKLRFPNSKARYYYVDFSNFNAERSFLCMSGVVELIDKLTNFCNSRGTDIFLYLPSNSVIWDDFVEKINICAEYGRGTGKIHIIRE